jgi:pimeloyl-ACP methyl ester carboxylesterase
MRRLEIVLCIVNVPLLIWCLGAETLPFWTRILPALALAIMVLQTIVEGIRWPIAPAYAVTICLFLAWSCPRAGLIPGRWTALCGISSLVAAAALGTVLAVFELPKPTGAYPVGTVTRHLIDSAREEANRPGEHRELMIQLWYPAERCGPRLPYRTRAETDLKKAHLALVQTHAARAVPVASARARYPVVVFSPSWTGRRGQNTVQAEELASHGFVVVGIDHPYGTELTIFPGGRAVRTTLCNLLDYSSDEAVESSLRKAEGELRIRAADVRFVLDELERLDRSDSQDLFSGRLDTGRAGIFGHSFGGAVAAEICLIDLRFKAGINLDGLIFGESMTHPIGKPFMILADDTAVPRLAELQAARGSNQRRLTFEFQNAQCIRQSLSRSRGYWFIIRGTSHMNFCDSPLYSPLRRLTQAGRIRPQRAMHIINTYLVSFFQRHLNGNDDGLVDAPSPHYPEVALQLAHEGSL